MYSAKREGPGLKPWGTSTLTGHSYRDLFHAEPPEAAFYWEMNKQCRLETPLGLSLWEDQPGKPCQKFLIYQVLQLQNIQSPSNFIRNKMVNKLVI